MKPSEIPLRYKIGVDRLMWGSDFPHDEGTFPYSREALRRTFSEIPPAELQQITSGNAAQVYGFDLATLQPHADRVGPTEKEIAQPLTDLPAGATSPVFNPQTIIRSW
jgi:hypothetical protein